MTTASIEVVPIWFFNIVLLQNLKFSVQQNGRNRHWNNSVGQKLLIVKLKEVNKLDFKKLCL
jgi:hypothetical protein